MKKLSLIAAVVLGTLVACSVAMAQEGGKDAAKKKAPSIDQRVDKMATQLNLTDDQKTKVKAIMEDSAKKMKDVAPADRREKGKAIREDETKQIKALLTDEQLKKFEAMPAAHGKKGGKKAEKKSE